MRLHHRVKVKPSRFLVGYATRTLGAAQTDAHFHATGCAQLYRWNRETAHPCHNCGHGPRLASLETGEPIAAHVTITRRDTGELVFEGDLDDMPMPLEPDMPTGVEGAEA